MDTNNITLEEYITETENRLKLFKKWWEAGNVDNPANFPNVMMLGEWDEQLMMYDEETDDFFYKTT